MKKILIIEDDPITGKIYHTQFANAGYDVELVADGQEGFYRIQEGKYDGVLLDLMLPHMGASKYFARSGHNEHFRSWLSSCSPRRS